MTPSGAPEALFFDMDGLLLDTEAVARDAFVAVAAGFGVAAAQAEEFFLTLVGSSSAVNQQRIAAFVPAADPERLRQEWISAFDRGMALEVPVKPTVSETLAALGARGHRMAVVTSTSGARARDHLGRAGLLGFLEAVVGGDEVRANKPDPAPYLEAAVRIGVDPARTVAFEDSDHGVASAVAAGCVVVQIPDLRPRHAALPDLGQAVLPDLAAAARALGLVD